jgi:hypothetical protein
MIAILIAAYFTGALAVFSIGCAGTGFVAY